MVQDVNGSCGGTFVGWRTGTDPALSSFTSIRPCRSGESIR